MEFKHITFALLIGWFAFSFIGCSRLSHGVPPAPEANRFLTGADGPPLWVIDNVEVVNPLENSRLTIRPADIKRVTVLSPASNQDLISRYGVKGRNGVVLMTTKKTGK